ncbi:sugar-binding domain-containing protein [Edaphobacter aggregans]|nr:sugar-binding domain-containing protein [Edaphobacter aggregans]
MRKQKLSRRTFLKATAAATLATQIKPSRAQATESVFPENGTLIPDEGWYLWVDEHAEWKNDTIFLPDEITRDADGALHGNSSPLPVNLPTGGWGSLSVAAAKEVVLPTTVEQHFWGKFGQRPYTPEEYRYGADDPIPQNGAYLGVSWWHRQIEIPEDWKGKRIFLHIRGARLRAEVFVNHKLVGYSIMEELPFECDLTHAADPGGFNLIAIRITNPFGRYDWVDGLNAQWGAVRLYRSHGFGGLDRGMTISAHGNVRIKDAWVLNTPSPKTIKATAVIETIGPSTSQLVNWELIDLQTGKQFNKGTTPFHGEVVINLTNSEDPIRGTGGISSETIMSPIEPLRKSEKEITFPEGELWDINSPRMYHLRITSQTSTGTDTRTIPFGFRTFAPDGLGSNAIFRLNGRRIKLYTAISWGYWGLNGLFPTPELAEKEVTQAKKLNLNCLNFHRNVGKEEVFRAHDRLGLLRYMEPGGGKLAIGAPAPTPSGEGAIANPGVKLAKPQTEADRFAQRFTKAKCVAMVRAFRSHPSLIQYTLQNEIGADLHNPDTIAILSAMRAEDPSRIIALNDGFSPPPRSAAQAWYEPWNDKLHRSDQEEWGGWWNNHQGAGDQWYDEFYTDPRTFTYKAPYTKVLTEYGEMEGCATPDNHSLMIHQITDTFARYGGTSFDLTDHKEILEATDKFLDRWNFRGAFPTTESLWLALGRKCYVSWQNYLENARISDPLDFAAISGWETTAIENHSGIVDNLRNFKSDPSPISGTLLPVRPVAKQRSACTPLGQSATFDLFLLNDTKVPATGTLDFVGISPSGKRFRVEQLPAPAHVPEQFSYLVKEALKTPPLTEEGLYTFKFALSSAPLATQTKEIWVANPKTPQRRPLTVGVSGITPALRKQLSDLLDVTVQDFVPGQKYDVIVSSGLTAKSSAVQNAGDTTGLEAQPAKPSTAPGVGKPEPGEGTLTTQPGTLASGILEAVQGGTPLFALPQTDVLSEGVAKQLAGAGAFSYNGTVGDFRAPWMGNWYFVRRHSVYEGMPVDQAMGFHYQAKGRQSNGLLVDGANVEIVAAYSRDHDRNIGAGTFTTKLGSTKVLYQRVPELHPVLQQRFLANALRWLTS